MELSVDTQLIQFALSIVFGASLGAFYDIFRIIRAAFSGGKIIVAIEDILYLFFSAILTFCFTFYINDGEIRAFMVIGSVLGAVVYYFTVGFIVIKSAKFIIFLIKKIIGFILAIIFFPFMKIYLVIRPVFMILYNKAQKITNFLKGRIGSLAKKAIGRLKKRMRKPPKKEGKKLDDSKTTKKPIKASVICRNTNANSFFNDKLYEEK